jgi:hypothetical protein
VLASDPGQTYNTSEVLAGLIASKPQMVLLGGDFAYADDWFGPEEPIDWAQYWTFTCELLLQIMLSKSL